MAKAFCFSRRIRRKLYPPTHDQRCAEKGLELPFCNARFSGHNSRDMSVYLLNMKRRISMGGIFGATISARLSMLRCATLILRWTSRDEYRAQKGEYDEQRRYHASSDRVHAQGGNHSIDFRLDQLQQY